jgi:hypothetical protein
MSQSITMAASALGHIAASDKEVIDLVRPMLEGSFGADWQRRAKLVYALKAAWQASGKSGEDQLIQRLNEQLMQSGSGYRVRAASLRVAESSARVLEIRDIRIDHVVDRQSFVF